MNKKCFGISMMAALAAFAQTAGPKTFGTPEQARDALVQAAASGLDALKVFFGPGSEEILRSGDPVQDKLRLERFNKWAAEKTELTVDAMNHDRVLLEVGKEEWPFPVPLIRKNGRWHWDLAEGKTEIRHRIIGGNELDAIQVCEGYVEAQKRYAEVDRTGDGVRQYARHLVSTPGKKDGLYWPGGDSPVAAAIAKATAEGYATPTGGGRPYHGYLYKILMGQGPDAYLGARDYLVHGVMIGGFGLVAWPAEYGVSGIKTFIVNQDGVVYEKDLGPNTAVVSKAMTKFNPDKSWQESPEDQQDSPDDLP